MGLTTVFFSLDHVRRRLKRHEPHRTPEAPELHRAAVAAILRYRGDAEILLIRRSEQPGDPWSGHMAFPGGRSDPTDDITQDTAERETREEVGLDLTRQAELLGRLDDLTAMARGRTINLVVEPFVYLLHDDVELTLNEEVDEALWTQLAPMQRGELDCTRPYSFEGQLLQLPAYQVGPHVVWGLTYRMLTLLFELMR